MHTATAAILSLSCLIPAAQSASTSGPACRGCLRSPPFPGGRTLYVPHCVDGKTINHCDALCSGLPVSIETSGSCDKCEQRCSQVFRAVCTQDQQTIFSNQCRAKCSGLPFTDCTGVGSSIIPGKSPLPPLPEFLVEKTIKDDNNRESEDDEGQF
eukprot:TRINITY_DN4575_c0_g1_i1.p1 TRINITY_DN4575_c0_g1~~TRINITY_DN4575_c0_g1_i1.p1  ORF type:complete len:155 (-),score=40.06 TRINITY_DN4575_c0_g1_i1:39-503(-)